MTRAVTASLRNAVISPTEDAVPSHVFPFPACRRDSTNRWSRIAPKNLSDSDFRPSTVNSQPSTREAPRLTTRASRLFCTPLIFAIAFSASAADIGAGRQKAQQECASCHEPKDWEGETPASLESLIKDAVRGKVKHSKKKLELTDTEIQNIAAYWAQNKK